jgi:phage tail sheath protein FI
MTIPGDPGISVGRTVNVNLLTLKPTSSSKGLNEFYSGEYLVTAVRHIIQPTVYQTVVEIAKDSSVKNYNPINVQMEISGSYANRSNYIYVKQVNYTTPNYLDNNGIAKPQYTSSIPVNASGAFGGAAGTIKGGANFYQNINSSNTQGLVGENYDNMIALLSNKDDYQFNVLLTPGLYDADYASQMSSIITNTQNRGDNIFILDPVKYNSNVSTVVSTAATRNTSYAAEYWPWCQIVDPETGNLAWVPASTVIAGVYAYNDSVSEPWFAPAGINRGGLSQVVRAEQKLSQTKRDTL